MFNPGEREQRRASSFPLLVQSSRLGIYVLVVLLAILSHLTQVSFFNWEVYRLFYATAAIGILLHSIPLFSVKKFYTSSLWMGLSFVLDIVLISFLLMQSGLHQSIFLFMYLVCILAAGLIFQSTGAFVVAALSSLGFTIASFVGTEVRALTFFFLLVLNNGAFFIIAWLAGYLSEQLAAQGVTLGLVRRLNELIVSSIPSGLILANENGNILTLNPSAERLIGAREDGSRGLFDYLPDLKDRLSVPHQELNINLDGETHLLETQIVAQAQREEKYYLIVLDDVTEIRKLELAVQQSEKLAAIG